MFPLVLASASPRRLQLLAQLGLTARVVVADIDESALPAEQDVDYVQRLAVAKAKAVAQQMPAAAVLAADTVISLDGQLIGKPRDQDHALQIWAALSGRCHQVLTAVAICHEGQCQQALSCSEVDLARLDVAQMQTYWASGEPQDKAGAYAVQGLAAQWIVAIRGSYSGIMGLPLYETAQLLNRLGIKTLP